MYKIKSFMGNAEVGEWVSNVGSFKLLPTEEKTSLCSDVVLHIRFMQLIYYDYNNL